MKKYLLLLALVCLLGNRALAQTKASYSQTVTEVTSFSGFNLSYSSNNPANIIWASNDNYIAGITQGNTKTSFASQLDGIYYFSVGNGNNYRNNWQIGQINEQGPNYSYLQMKNNTSADLHIHNLKIGDEVKLELVNGQNAGYACKMGSNNTTINQGTELSGTVEFQIKNNKVNRGRVTLTFDKQYSGIIKIQVVTTKPHFNYDPGFEVYDFFQIGTDNNPSTDYTATVDAGFTLNGNQAKYFRLGDNTDLSLNDRIAVCQSSGWRIKRGIQAPEYSDGNSQWYNVSICNLYVGDRVEIFYTGDAPTFSSNGMNGSYTGSGAFKDVKNDGEYNPEEGDQLIYAGKELEGGN